MEIDLKTLKELQSINIIDLREKAKYEKKHLHNSINVSLTYLLIYPQRYLEKGKKYVLVCDYGLSSQKASKILNKMGYATYSLKDGVNNI